jgi:signal transduction histidine kinase/ActR/RegA family two-component response regulator
MSLDVNQFKLNSEALGWINGLSVPGILITDAELVIQGWNQWLETSSGRKASEMIGQKLFEAYPDLITRQLDGYYRDALAGQEKILSQGLHSYLLPMRPVLKDERFEFMQQSARIGPLLDGNRVIGTVTLIEDVTERTAAEKELLKLLAREQSLRAEAEAANRAKDDFLATLSHELRTPLNAIIGWAEILSKGDCDRACILQAAEVILRNAKQQTSIIEDLIDVSRVIAGKLQLEKQPVEVVPLVGAALDAVRPAADAKKISFELVRDSAIGCVEGDPNRLQQIIWNLLSNAIKFTRRGGKVTVRLNVVEGFAQVVVSDTGEGISADFLPHIFERFRQADSTSTRKHSGLGLGLALVRHLTEMHGGTVEASSAGIGQGATFTIKLPLATESHKSSDGKPYSFGKDVAAPAQEMPTLAGLNVLVIDDDLDSREFLGVLLNMRGATAKMAATVAEALDILNTWMPDVLVSDIGMPHEDGYELIRQLRARDARNGGVIPALALTGYAGPEESERALRSGYQMYLAKPVESLRLIDAIATLAGKAGKSEWHESKSTGIDHR